MSSAVPIHPMIRLMRQHAMAASASASGPSVALSLARQGRSRRCLTTTIAAYAKRAAKSTSSISAAGQTSSSPSASSRARREEMGSRLQASSGVTDASSSSAEAASKDSAALRAYAASARGAPKSPPPAIKVTDTRSEQQKKRGQEMQQESQQQGDASKEGGAEAAAKSARQGGVAGGSSLQADTDRSEPTGALKMLSKDAPFAAPKAGSDKESTTQRPQGEDESTKEAKPLAEGIIIHAHPSSDTSSDSGSSRSGPFENNDTGSASNAGSAFQSSESSSIGAGPSSSMGDNGGASGPPMEGAPASDAGSEAPAQFLHPFDTHAFVKKLQEAAFIRRQAMPSADGKAEQESTSLVYGHRHDPAEAIMGALRHLLVTRGDNILGSHINNTERENQSYLFSAALAELRTELQVRARNDAAALRSMVTLVQREVDALNQRMREDVAGMKHDIQVDMNNRKGEAKDEQNSLEQEIQDLNNRFTISISDLKTEIEQSIKWDATRRALTLFFGSVVILIATLALADYLTRDLEKDEGGTNSAKREGGGTNARPDESSGNSTDSSLSRQAILPGTLQSQNQQGGGGIVLLDTRPRSAEELGVLPQYDEEHGSRFV